MSELPKVKPQIRTLVLITSRGLGMHYLIDQHGKPLGFGGIHYKTASERATKLQEKLDKEFTDANPKTP